MVGYDREKDLNAGTLIENVKWVPIPEGKFTLGTSDFPDAKPIKGKTYTIKAFEMSQTLVTVEQYDECVDQKACTKPASGVFCNSNKKYWDSSKKKHFWENAVLVSARRLHPVNCVNWDQANQYAAFLNQKPENMGKKVRLPSESEWEYAARSGGKQQKHPWGNEDATCERAGRHDCGGVTTMPVCSKPAGHTIIDGLPGQGRRPDCCGKLKSVTFG